MKFKIYTEEKKPKKHTTAYKIWKVLEKGICELHYNANCYGKGKNKGWGTWACYYEINGKSKPYFCGLDEDNEVWLQIMHAPFTKRIIGKYKK